VRLAAFGHRLFDASSFNPTTTRLAGVTPVSWALEDANRDGIEDLVLTYRARDMAFNRSAGDSLFDAKLQDGGNVYARVVMRQVPGPRSAASEELVVERLEIESVRMGAGGKLRAAIFVYSGDPATIELFDVSGRRLAREVVAFSRGETRTVELTPGSMLRAGVYFVRLSQRGEGRMEKVIVLH
jgi:hypothetical protein